MHKLTSQCYNVETATKPTYGLAQRDFCPSLAAAAYHCTVQSVIGVCCGYPAAAATFVHSTHCD